MHRNWNPFEDEISTVSDCWCCKCWTLELECRRPLRALFGIGASLIVLWIHPYTFRRHRRIWFDRLHLIFLFPKGCHDSARSLEPHIDIHQQELAWRFHNRIWYHSPMLEFQALPMNPRSKQPVFPIHHFQELHRFLIRRALPDRIPSPSRPPWTCPPSQSWQERFRSSFPSRTREKSSKLS